MLLKSELKYIQSLFHKMGRDQEGLFIAEGPKIVTEFSADKTIRIRKMYALPSFLNKIKIAIDSTEVTEEELQKISQNKTPNEVLAVVEKIKWEENLKSKDSICIALDTIQDPGNLGTIIRLADWFGVKQIVCSLNCADVYNSKVVQSSMGSIARVQVEYLDLKTWFQENSESRIYGATLNGRDITSMEKIKKGIIVIGNESKGISEELLPFINVQITIPGKGNAESLNAGVATGIILSHLI